MKKSASALAFVIGALLLSAAAAPAPLFYASSKSTVFHKAKCEFVKRIPADTMVSFPSKEEAVKKGFKPCPVCKP